MANYFPRLEIPHRVERGFDRFDLTFTQMFDLIKECKSNSGEASSALRDSPEWAGIDCSPSDYLSSRGAPKALRDFQTASVTLETEKSLSTIAAMSGSVWSIPQVINNQPMSARVRVRKALPPKAFDIHLSVSASMSHETVARIVARVARAAREYAVAGGIPTVRAILENEYKVNSSRGTSGCVLFVTPNISSDWEIAQTLSIQAFRAIAISVSQALSGQSGDSLRVSTLFASPSGVNFHGFDSAKAEAQLHALGVR